MIAELYKAALDAQRHRLETMTFPQLIAECREIMGLYQYAAAEYLGIALPRYKRIELGLLNRKLDDAEIARLSAFYGPTIDDLRKKESEHLSRPKRVRDAAIAVWEQ